MSLRRVVACALILTAFALSACVLPGGKPAAKPTQNPITGGAVTVQSLDAPAALAPSPSVKPAAPVPVPVPLPAPVAGLVDASLDAITAAEAARKPAAPKATAQNAPADEAAKAPPQAADAAAAEAPEPAPPPPPESPEAAKCQKSGGLWATAGESGAKACVRRTKDAGKACTKQSQCEGLCLARSRTCAPITPMFGCNDILQADGREVTLCLD